MTNNNLPKLKDIIDGMDWQNEEMSHYLNKKTGKVCTITSDEMWAAENSKPLDEYPEWQHESIKTAGEILTSDDYLSLPSQYDIHEYSIMERFCRTIGDDEIREEMYSCIRGSGAFGRFKDNIHQYDLADQWYSYKEEALKKIAIDWCRENDVEFTDN